MNSQKPQKVIYTEQSRLQAATDPGMTLARVNYNNIRRKPKNKKNKNPNRKRKPNNKNRKQSNMFVKTVMSSPHPCIAQYLSALIDPRNTPQGACVPWGFPIPSQRIKVSARGTFQLGTTGKGFIYSGLGLCSDSNIAAATTNLSVGANGTLLSAFTNLTSIGINKFPYTTSQINGPSNARYVAGGVRVRYGGTEAARNGIVTCYETTQFAVQGLAYNTFGQDINARNERPPPDGTWHSCYFSGPVSAGQVAFTTGAAWAANYPLVIYIQGVAADLYEYEIYAHVEYNGESIPGMSMSHSDPVGYAQVLESVKKTTASEPLSDNNSQSTFSEFFRNAGSSIGAYIKKEGMSMAMETISNYFLPGSKMAKPLLLTYK
jgi:hypothetical protein